jgi:twitching motility protein PilT
MLDDILRMCQEMQASDLHLMKNEPPVLRRHGTLFRSVIDPLTEDELSAMLLGILTEEQRATLERDCDVNVARELVDGDRFRINIHRQKGALEAAIRRIPREIPTLQALGLPAVVGQLAMRPNGLVLVTGAVGMGKTTTLASMIDLINRQREALIVSIEDPIEYVHTSRHSFIKQREVGSDTPAFASALKNALRQDPNVIVVGEMLDIDTVATAVTAAETGHLVLATMHTSHATQALHRILDVFPAGQQGLLAAQLADCLQGVIAQTLLPSAEGEGRVLATEVLVTTDGIRNLIRSNHFEQIYSQMETGAALGMQTLDRALEGLVKAGKITCETAQNKVRFPERFVCPVNARIERTGWAMLERMPVR